PGRARSRDGCGDAPSATTRASWSASPSSTSASGLAASLRAMDVSVIGLGRVGLPLSLCFADAGMTVLGIDKDADRLETVRAGRMPFKEPGADELLSRTTLE